MSLALGVAPAEWGKRFSSIETRAARDDFRIVGLWMVSVSHGVGLIWAARIVKQLDTNINVDMLVALYSWSWTVATHCWVSALLPALWVSAQRKES